MGPSAPRDVNGTSTDAIIDPATVDNVAHKKDPNSLPVDKTRDKLPEKSKRGTANGSRYELTTP